jgi:hypothetical protein
MITTEEFSTILKEKGWVKFDNVLPEELIHKLNGDLEKAYETCRSIQLKNGVNVNTDGTVHHVLGQGESFLEVISGCYLFEYLKTYFGQPFIVNSYGGIINIMNKLSYVGNIHRDIRTFYNVPMMINMLIMLDDFTLDNGATYFLNGSHLKDEKPEADFFYTNAVRATGKAGDIILFDSNLWHAAGKNQTEKERRALTLTFTRPFWKQQMDYPRFVGHERMNEFSENVKQVLGYHSRTPANLDEWYQPVEKRFYKRDQG